MSAANSKTEEAVQGGEKVQGVDDMLPTLNSRRAHLQWRKDQIKGLGLGLAALVPIIAGDFATSLLESTPYLLKALLLIGFLLSGFLIGQAWVNYSHALATIEFKAAENEWEAHHPLPEEFSEKPKSAQRYLYGSIVGLMATVGIFLTAVIWPLLSSLSRLLCLGD